MLIEHNLRLDAEYAVHIAAEDVGEAFALRFCELPAATVTSL